jgi:casein kinase I family protein HRR25
MDSNINNNKGTNLNEELLTNQKFITNFNKKLGSGTFCEVYYGKELFSDKDVAIKLELKNSKYQLLSYEYKIYKQLEGDSIP